MITDKRAVEDSGVPKNKKAKIARVKNKMPAAVQITAEQLLREAKERELEVTPKAPQQKITSLSELRDFQLRKRKDYEDNIRKNRLAMQNWIKYAKFEETQGELQRARSVFERALDVDYRNVGLWLKYAEMEMRHKQYERARVIYKYALENLPKDDCQEIYKAYTLHEKKYGDRLAIEDVILSKRKFQYEEEVQANPHNYDVWFDYVRLMEEEGSIEQTREIYERAVANVPPIKGTALGMCPKDKLFRGYIELEIQLREFDRCRKLYEKFLEFSPENCTTWMRVWLSLANFELCALNKLTAADLDDEDLEHLKDVELDKETLIQEHNENEINKAVERSRKIYQEANKALKYTEDKEQRVRLLEAWKEFEYEYGTEKTQRDVDKLQPQKVVRSRRLGDERSGWEEYIEYTFPDTDAEKPNQKLLTMAARWAEQMERKKAAAEAESKEDSDSSEESEEEEDDLQGDEDDNRIPEREPTWFDRKNKEEIEIDEDSD
ncbi:Crooked neck-like protein 1 [Schistosoma haematobium]|uniref:Crooked neck-like protein 1 n=1 Tax=Schistosoma haematobium TaxID=6185 RepID=A0A922IRM8_SCHHA|nr:Crooked neck-like protein 1 [Schistosoma haematobium]KAH9585407.1 Crooked neck-like protein 1 [Schistosoma haematobium]